MSRLITNPAGPLGGGAPFDIESHSSLEAFQKMIRKSGA